MKRAETFKVDLFTSYNKSHSAIESTIAVEELFINSINKDKLESFYKDCDYRKDKDDNVSNCLKIYHSNFANNKNYPKSIIDLLLEDIEIKQKKDFYIRSLFNELFYFLNFYSADIEKCIKEFFSKINFSSQYYMEMPGDFIYFVEDSFNDDILYVKLVTLYYNLVKNKYNSVITSKSIHVPVFSSINDIVNIIHPCSEENNLHKLFNFLEEPNFSLNYKNLHTIKVNIL